MSLSTTTPSLASQRTPLNPESGVTIIEVVIAMVVLVVGVLGMAGGFDGARKLTLLSERRTEMAHRAQLELELLQQEPYARLAMATAPKHEAESVNPDYYVNSSPTTCKSEGDGCYAWNEANTKEEEPLVAASANELCEGASPKTGCGVVASSPIKRECTVTTIGACEWKEGNVTGATYDFVTWHADSGCGTACPKEKNYKRLTVVVTAKVSSGTHQPNMLRVSTLVAEQ